MNRIILMFSFLVISSFSLFAQQAPVFSTAEGAIQGYDAVAYFKAGKSVKGDPKYNYTWDGASWYFSSQKNLEIFKASPDDFAPQYGGYCAYGAAGGHKAPTDPNAWSIVNNKLYLNYNKDVQQRWKKDQQDYIRKADINWPSIMNK